MSSQINMKIPGKVAWDELMFLSTLASRVPAMGQIVEIGPLYGRSTFSLAKSAPQATVTSIDTFENAEWIQKYAASSKDIPQFGLEAFKKFTSQFENVNPIVGFSPQVVSDWSKPIDMYFEDATHGNPNLKENMNFWISHLKPGGIACGHDYTLRFPDVKREVDEWAKRWGTIPKIVGSLWAIQKPENGVSQPTLHTIEGVNSVHNLVVHTKNKRFGHMKTRSGYWAGAHLDADPLNWISIDFSNHDEDLQLRYNVRHPKFGQSGWKDAGEKAMVIHEGCGKPIWEFAAKLSGKSAEKFKVYYRVAYRQIGNGGYKLSEISEWTSQGKWCSSRYPGANACSISITIAKNIPPSVQAEFHSSASLMALDNYKRARRFLSKIKHRLSIN